MLAAAAESLQQNDEAKTPLEPPAEEQGETGVQVSCAPFAKSWERYEIVELLGEGNMGQVYKAYDPLLQRYVALKFLRGEDPRLLSQFLREARAQARVEHEHICKVYEVGEFEKKHCIAMQCIAGKTLKAAADEMTLEEKIQVIKLVADAVHAAHKTGLIHRDLKPGNIMMEKTGAGWKPYVMDFGLAREQEGPGATSTGTVVGSPCYMAPEQARGEVHKLDRRTDVYGLGATLYELLTGHPPFEGFTSTEVLIKVLQEEPQFLRRKDPSVPKDLETVTMKCLEKEPQKRYESAKALAEDLERYVQGEPIRSKPASWTYSALKKVKKHRAVAATASLALVAVFLLAGLWIHARWTAAEQARLAQQFGQEAEKIEGFMRYAYALPLHDVRRERAVIEDRMKWIEAEMKRIGNLGQGPGNYALGRGYGALHEYQKAREHLTQAWTSGYQQPEVAYALGQVLGSLYQEALQEAERIGGKELREAGKKQAEREYRDPALLYLKAGGGAKMEAPVYVEGLIAFYEKRYEDCLEKVGQASRQVPWLYEAQLLEGNVRLQMGSEQRKFGEYKKAMENFSLATKKFQEASAMARSDAGVYESQCRLWDILERVTMDTGQSPQEAFDAALRTCGDALTANPESAEAFDTQAHATWLKAWYDSNSGKDPSGLFEKSIQLSLRAQSLDPGMVASYDDMASAYHYLGAYIAAQGSDPTSHLQKAIENCEKAIHIDPNYVFSHINEGGIYSEWGMYEWKHGLNPEEFFHKAIESLQKAEKLNPEVSAIHNTLGIVYTDLGEYAMYHGANPQEFYKKAIESQERAIALNPNIPYSYANLGGQYINLGEYALQHGEDPTQYMYRGIDIFKRAITTNPSFFYTHMSVGVAYFHLGTYAVRRGADPTEFENNAVTSLKKALELNDQYLDTYLYLGMVYTQMGKYQAGKKLSPQALGLAESYLKSAVKLSPSSSEPYLRMGELEIVRAQWEVQAGKSPAELLGKSRKNMEKAFELNSEDVRNFPAMAKLCQVEAEWNLRVTGQATEDVEKGLAITRKMLSINPNSAETLAIQGALYLVQARAEKSQKSGQEAARNARASLDKALQMNPLLQREYQPLLKQISLLH